MRALRDGARTQGDRKGSPLLETAWQADPPVYSRGWACPCPAALHSFFHSPAESFMVARVLFPVLTCGATRSHHHRAAIKTLLTSTQPLSPLRIIRPPVSLPGLV